MCLVSLVLLVGFLVCVVCSCVVVNRCFLFSVVMVVGSFILLLIGVIVMWVSIWFSMVCFIICCGIRVMY